MMIYTGKLHFLGWSESSWALLGDDDSIDLKRLAQLFFVQHSGNTFSCDLKGGLYAELHFLRDATSDLMLRCEDIDEGVDLFRKEPLRYINIATYLEQTLCNINGRQIEVTIDSESFRIKAINADMLTLQYFDGNSARIPEGAERDVCKIGKGADTCIFLTCGAKGWSCEKFSSLGRTLLQRHARSEMAAVRIGDCAVVGREEDLSK